MLFKPKKTDSDVTSGNKSKDKHSSQPTGHVEKDVERYCEFAGQTISAIVASRNTVHG